MTKYLALLQAALAIDYNVVDIVHCSGWHCIDGMKRSEQEQVQPGSGSQTMSSEIHQKIKVVGKHSFLERFSFFNETCGIFLITGNCNLSTSKTEHS